MLKFTMVEFICLKCQYIGKPKRIKRGSRKIEFWGWMMFPLGLPYTLWRMLSKQRICAHCTSQYLQSITSPIGMKMIEAMSKEAPSELSFEEFEAQNKLPTSKD